MNEKPRTTERTPSAPSAGYATDDQQTWKASLERLETKAANHKAAILLLLDEAHCIRQAITALCEVYQERTGELRGPIPNRLHDALVYQRKSL